MGGESQIISLKEYKLKWLRVTVKMPSSVGLTMTGLELSVCWPRLETGVYSLYVDHVKDQIASRNRISAWNVTS